MLNIGTDFSGVGAFEQALRRLGIEHKTIFACDMDEYARQTFVLNYGTEEDVKLVYSKKHSELCKKIKRVVDKNELFEAKHQPLFDEAEAFAKQFSFYFPWNVYNREIPEEPLDIYVPTPPCQSFSIAGKRGGESDKRGILFYNSHEFIKKNKPKAFIFENVQGLLSDDGGKTFANWIALLGGKSVNGYETFFPNEDSVPYHIFYKVLNAKHYGIPQNRDRIFIIGIRDDDEFFFPKKIKLIKKLRDCLEEVVDEKYFLSEATIQMYVKHTNNQKAKGNGFKFEPSNLESEAAAITTRSGSRADDNFIDVGTWRTHEDGKGFRPTEDNNCPTIPARARAREDGSGQPVIKITTNTEKGFEEFTEGDSLNLSNSNSNSNSKTRRGRVGKGTAQTLDTGCAQAVIVKEGYINQDTQASQVYGIDGIAPGICAGSHGYAMGYITDDSEEKSENWIRGGTQKNQPYQTDDTAPCLVSAMGQGGGHVPFHNYSSRIRRLTPLECFILMDFNFDIPGVPDFKWAVSDTQAYKQAGNSVCVGMFVLLIKQLLKIK